MPGGGAADCAALLPAFCVPGRRFRLARSGRFPPMVKEELHPSDSRLMAQPPSAFLVARRDDGFGDVFPLHAGHAVHARPRADQPASSSRTTCAAASTPRCSRPTAAGASATSAASTARTSTASRSAASAPLRPLDEVRVGRTRLVFVDDLGQLPGPAEGRRRRRRTGRRARDQQAARPDALPAADASPTATTPTARRDRASPPPQAVVGAVPARPRHGRRRRPRPSSCELVVDALFRATPAEVGAVLALKEGRELEPVVHRTAAPGRQTYHKVSQFVSHEVLSTQAGDPGRERGRRPPPEEPREPGRTGGRQPDLRPGPVRRPGARADPPVLHRPARPAQRGRPGVHPRRRPATRRRLAPAPQAGDAVGREPQPARPAPGRERDWSARATRSSTIEAQIGRVGGDEGDGADPRRERRRQGTGRPGDPLQPARGATARSSASTAPP